MSQGVPPAVSLYARWRTVSPGGPAQAAVIATVPCRPELGPEERVFRFSEVRLYAGDVAAGPEGVEAQFLLEFWYIRGTALWSKRDRSSLSLKVTVPPPPGYRRQVTPDLGSSRCLGAMLSGGGREMLAEVRLVLAAT